MGLPIESVPSYDVPIYRSRHAHSRQDREVGFIKAPRVGTEQNANSAEKQGSALRRDAFSDALCVDSVSDDAQLAELIAAWPTLPEPTRQAMLALVRAGE